MARINQQLLNLIEDLKSIIMLIDVMMVNKGDAILLRQAYANNIAHWTIKINELRITKKTAKYFEPISHGVH